MLECTNQIIIVQLKKLQNYLKVVIEIVSIKKTTELFKGCKVNCYITVQYKKNTKRKRVDFGKFGGAEHEYKIYFFLAHQVFSAFYILI